tara:strand:+ start:2026 stop:2796 length:771 start_codon:yes stop_codon:yes gene_type:complete
MNDTHLNIKESQLCFRCNKPLTHHVQVYLPHNERHLCSVCADETHFSKTELLKLVGGEHSDTDYAVMRRHYREMLRQTPWYKEESVNWGVSFAETQLNIKEVLTTHPLEEIMRADQDLYDEELSIALFTKLERFIDEIHLWDSNPYLKSIGEGGCICVLEADICTVWCGCTPDMVRARENTPATEREPLTCHFGKCYDDGAHATEIRDDCGCYDRSCDEECGGKLVEGKDYVIRSYKEYLPSYFETEEGYQEYLRG